MEEWKRVSELKIQIINDFDFDGIKMVLQKCNVGNEFYLLENAPEDCPWRTEKELAPEEVIEQVFLKLKDEVPNMIRALKSHCFQWECGNLVG